jgi:SAM-dependent methyltransferase
MSLDNDKYNSHVRPADIVQKGETSGSSEPIIDLFSEDNYVKSDKSNIHELYNKMSQSDYEQFLVHINFTEPYYLRDAVIGRVKEGGLGISDDRKEVEILDLGCGTGIVGFLIRDAGFTNIWGLDASSGFIDMINNNGIYKGGEVLYLGQGVERFPAKYKNRFDLVTGTGCFLPKHVPSLAFDDAHSALKVGGIFCFTLRSNLWEDGHDLGYKDAINNLVADGKMKFLDHVSKDFWRGKEKGIGLFERQQSKIFALEKLA